MANRRKTLESYPLAIVTAWQALIISGELSLECSSNGEAVSIRQQMYSYRKLVREAGRPESLDMDTYQLEILKLSNGIFLNAKKSLFALRAAEQLSRALGAGISPPVNSPAGISPHLSEPIPPPPSEVPEHLREAVELERARIRERAAQVDGNIPPLGGKER